MAYKIENGVFSCENNLFGGSLDLRGTGITSLPDGLHVGGDLDLSGTGITSLNVNIVVFGIKSSKLTFIDLAYQVYITDSHIKIGCQLKTVSEWRAITEKECRMMDGDKAVSFFKNDLPTILDMTK